MKKIIFLFILLFLVISVSSIKSTLSYYVDEVEKNANYEIANWVIKVNGSDITKVENKEFSINDINLDIPDSSIEGLKISNEKFAPGTSGSFNILLDLASVDTSINYTLTIDTTSIDDSNIVIDSVKANDEELILDNGVYKKILNIDYIKSKKEEMIAVNFKWLELDNNKDIDYGEFANSKLKLPIEISLEQVLE